MIQDTGERAIPKLMDPMNPMLLEHIARYQFATKYVNGRVLDLACGAGYGTHMIAKQKKDVIDEVIGVDIDPNIVRYAMGEYYHPKSTYLVKDATDTELVNYLGTFDVIMSFETFEHIYEEDKILENYDRLLNPGGTLIVSTPFGKGRGKPCGNPFHVHQLTVQEFQDLFYRFDRVEFYGQRGVLIEPFNHDHHYPIGIAVCNKSSK